MKCKICNLTLKSKRKFINHLKTHNIQLLEYYIKYENFKIPKCNVCNNDCAIRQGITFQKTCGNSDCKAKNFKLCWTNKKRKTQGEKRKKYLKTHKHNWGSIYRNIESLPEKKFKKIIEKYDLKVYQWFKSDEFERFFEIDFAIPNLKIGYEINGNQHYNTNGTLSKYYKDRHDIIESKGWTLIEIPYLLCFNEKYISKIIEKSTKGKKINFIKPVKRIKRINKEKIQKELMYKERIKNNLKKQQENIEKNKNKIINSNINFSKFGWVIQVSKILNCSPQYVNRWIKKNMLDFYKEKCFKRNGTII